MSTAIIRENGVTLRIEYRCDSTGCKSMQTDHEFIAGGGMAKMGWVRREGELGAGFQLQLFCPLHAKE